MKGPCVLAQKSARHALKQRVHVLRGHVKAAAAHDVDGIHDLRVASRRLRAALGDFAGRFKKRALKPLRKRARDVTRGLGKARELDVTLGLLRAMRRDAPKELHPAIARASRMLRAMRDEQSSSVDASCAFVRDHAFRTEIGDLIDADRRSETCYRKETALTLRKRYTRLASAYREWIASPSDDSLHQVRIAFKKLRYSCEIARDLYGERMDALIEKIKGAQETLGDWNDVRVLRDYLVACAKANPGMAAEFANIEARCDETAKQHLDDFAKRAPQLLDKSARAAANELFSTPEVVCCVRRGGRTSL
ncbi:MAG: CHAD domain-containing protein [Candidatus Hydrogenedentes bacterium]|nr:CHAD domain-containing protein [Candidatus Hydrogenedentota bacterium]